MEETDQTPDDCNDCIDKIVGKKRLKRRSRKLHKWIGVIITLPLLWITITGIILNHTVDWKLDQIKIESQWLKNHYGMAPTGEPTGYIISANEASYQIIEWDGVIYFNSSPIEAQLEGRLLGVLYKEGSTISIVTEYNVLQLDEKGNLIEKLDELSLPELPITAVAQQGTTLYLKNAEGWHTPDADWLEMTAIAKADAPLASIALSTIENQTVKDKLMQNWSRSELPASRVILDLHSGRFFGTIGKYLYDLVAICTILLSITGIALFFRKPRRRLRK